jgi:HAD superfamily hydrolase (TIGR01509 family)
MSLEALVFDVDGTIADTEEAHRQAFNAAFDEHDLGWHWSRNRYSELLRVSGGRERMLLHLESLQLPPAEKKALADRLADIHRSKVRIYKTLVETGRVPLRLGVKRLIDEARAAGLKLGIATTGTAAGVEALIAHTLGKDAPGWFQVFAAGEQVANKKPAPEIYQLVLRWLGAPPATCIAFEDSENGVKAAHAAGLFVVATPTFWTLDQDFSQADLMLPTLGDPESPIPPAIAAHRTGGAAFVNLALLERLHAAAATGAAPA